MKKALRKTVEKWEEILQTLEKLDGEIGEMCPMCYLISNCDDCPLQSLCNALQDGYFKGEHTVWAKISFKFEELLNLLNEGFDALVKVKV